MPEMLPNRCRLQVRLDGEEPEEKFHQTRKRDAVRPANVLEKPIAPAQKREEGRGL